MLGVEMASTGEVACFGANKEEAFLKVGRRCFLFALLCFALL